MKKNVILGIIIALLVVAVAVEGFFLWKQNSDQKKEEGKGDTEQVEQTPSPEPSKEPKKLPKDETIDGENLKISKKYSNPKNDELVYTYLTVTVEGEQANEKFEVPQINLESKDVEKINKKILEKYEDIVDEINETQETDFMCEGLSYRYYENDGILSLVMLNPTESGAVFKCDTYNVETETGEKLKNTKIIEKFEIQSSDLIDKMESSIENTIKQFASNGNYESREELMEEIKEKAIEKALLENINDYKLYINDESHLCMYMETINLGIAGGESGTYIFDLEEINKVYGYYTYEDLLVNIFQQL